MHEPYENSYIGSFIFALGFAAAKQNQHPQDAFAHLIQQTPKDKDWADLLASWGGRQYLFEFKRTEAHLHTERTKSYHLANCKKGCEEFHPSSFFEDIVNDDKNRRLSRRCHFAIYGAKFDDVPTMQVMRYSEIIDSRCQTAKFCSVAVFTKVMFKNQRLGASAEEMCGYLTFLSECVGKSATGSTGVIISVTEDGSMKVALIEDIGLLAADIHAEPPEPDLGLSPPSNYYSSTHGM